jgi:hypothetical protein
MSFLHLKISGNLVKKNCEVPLKCVPQTQYIFGKLEN